MHQVFISYSTKDQAQADTVRSILESNGISCWMAPRDIPGGSNYTKEIPIAIRDCQVFVLILSQHSQNSHWVLKELDAAVNHSKVILPFMLDNCQLNDEFNFLLTGAQRYEAYRRKADVLEALICRIRAITGDAPSTAKDAVAASDPVTPMQTERYFGLTRCPACGGDDLVTLSNKVGAFSISEHCLRLLPFLTAIPGGFIAAIAMAIVLAFIPLDQGVFDAALAISLIAGIIAGAIAGRRIANEQIRRRRIRKGFRPEPLCCADCKQTFLVNKNS